jgi:hypothetical protein
MILFGSTLDAAQVAQLSPPAVASSVGKIVSAIVSAVGSGALSVARLDAAVLRVLEASGTDVCG